MPGCRYWVVVLGTLASVGCKNPNSKQDEATFADAPSSGNTIEESLDALSSLEQTTTSDATHTDATHTDATHTDASLAAPPACAPAPCISHTHAVHELGRVSVAFSGWGSKDGFDAVILNLPSGDSASVRWRQSLSDLRFRDGGSHGSLLALENGSFSGYLSVGYEGALDTATLELIYNEWEERVSIDVRIAAKTVQNVGAGELCDLGALLYRCTHDLVCDTTDHTQGTACRPPVAECESAENVPPLTLAGVTGNVSWLEAEDFTLGSCSRQRGSLGADNRFRFVPDEAGTYRFTFLGEGVTLFVRRRCEFPDPSHSELGCVSTLSAAPGAQDTASLEVELEADVPYFVFVEGGWATGGPYTLNVAKLP